jgi:hypothetical protein
VPRRDLSDDEAMRDDLLHAQASVDWRLISYQSWKPGSMSSSVPNNVVVAVQREELPRSFNVEIGAHLNAIRSGLDLLASALAGRYGICPPESAFFPIARSEDEFRRCGSRSASFVAGLPPAERSRLEALKPYHGGNDDLWSLHQLDNMRKHRRLLIVTAEPELFSVQGSGVHQHFTPVATATGLMRADNVSERKVVLGLMAKDAPLYDMKFTPHLLFDESAITRRRRVVRTLREFAQLATSVIMLFDT